MPDPPTIVVTGAAGFIGSNLCRMLLGEGYRVRGIDNLSAGTLENVPASVDFVRADIRDLRALEPILRGAQAVFHLAAKNCLADCLQDPAETAAVNVFGTANVLQACLSNKIQRFIYADTSAEYEGIRDFPTPVDSVAPLGPYAISKRAGWMFCDAFARWKGLRLTTLRYFNVYGPAQDYRRTIPPVVSAFALKLLSGQRPVIYGTGEKRRDFIYVDDVNRFHLLCLRDERTLGKIYNSGSGVNHSVQEVFDVVEGILRSGLSPVFKPELPGEAAVTLADLSHERALGWEPQVEFRKGVELSIEYLREKLSDQSSRSGRGAGNAAR